MYISRRTGGGRGVYEIAGRTEDGLSATDLQERELVFRLDPYVRLKTGLQLKIQGGKPRLVIKKEIRTQGVVQIQRQITALLLLPKPIRADKGFGNHHQVIQKNQYAVEKLAIQSSSVDESAFEFVPTNVVLKNATTSIDFGFLARFAKVVKL